MKVKDDVTFRIMSQEQHVTGGAEGGAEDSGSAADSSSQFDFDKLM